MALFPSAVLRLIPPGASDPRITARVLIFHVAVSEAASLYEQFSNDDGIESHFYVRRDGTIEQYRDTAWQADANMAANDFAISVETQGMAAGEWTPAQIISLKAIALWCHDVHHIPLTVCPAWDGSGVGYHILFMAQWAGGPRACPGPERIAQFWDVLVPWMSNPTAPAPPKTGALMALTDDQQQAMFDRVMQLPFDFGTRFLATQGAAQTAKAGTDNITTGVKSVIAQNATLIGFNAGLLAAIHQVAVSGGGAVDLVAIQAAARAGAAAAIDAIDVTVHGATP